MEVCSLTYMDSRGIFHLKKDLASLTTVQVREFSQIREIKAYKGQAHMPGFFYITRTKSLVAYESRLEMLILMQIDFNPSTVAVVSQPFILHAGGGKNSFEHIPDFLTISTAENIAVIDVKPKTWVTRAENLRKFKGTRAACEVAGWNYSVQTEPDRLFIENLRWLTGYRRRPPTTDTYAKKLIEAC